MDESVGQAAWGAEGRGREPQPDLSCSICSRLSALGMAPLPPSPRPVASFTGFTQCLVMSQMSCSSSLCAFTARPLFPSCSPGKPSATLQTQPRGLLLHKPLLPTFLDAYSLVNKQTHNRFISIHTFVHVHIHIDGSWLQTIETSSG